MRRDQDIINPKTSHCNIMLLAQPGLCRLPNDHPFIYGRVLGIFHVNVFYRGPGAVDNDPQRFDCLWVRWYNLEAKESQKGTREGATRATGRQKVYPYRLDRLSFQPWEAEDAFGFVDPADVLRGCHVIPAFSAEKSFPNGKGLSSLARDFEDWNAYYISR